MSVVSTGYCASGLLGGGYNVCSICVKTGGLFSLISLKFPFELISREKSSEKNVKDFVLFTILMHWTERNKLETMAKKIIFIGHDERKKC